MTNIKYGSSSRRQRKFLVFVLKKSLTTSDMLSWQHDLTNDHGMIIDDIPGCHDSHNESQIVGNDLKPIWDIFEVRETPAAAFVDGKAGLGAVVGQFSMEIAIQKARGRGIIKTQEYIITQDNTRKTQHMVFLKRGFSELFMHHLFIVSASWVHHECIIDLSSLLSWAQFTIV